MVNSEWSGREKKIARRAFDDALDRALARTMAEFQKLAAAATKPADMWDLEDFLHQRRAEIDRTFDYRYSQLPRVFGLLILEGCLTEAQLDGLSEDKIEEIRRVVSFGRQRE